MVDSKVQWHMMKSLAKANFLPRPTSFSLEPIIEVEGAGHGFFFFIMLHLLLFPVYCLDPPLVQHATHNGSPETVTYPLETVLKYTCYPGYLTVGFAHAKCFLYNDTAQWFGPDITCKGEPKISGVRSGGLSSLIA